MTSRGSGLASGYAVLSGLMLAASLGWLWVAAFVVVVGPWLGWRHVRRAG